MKRTTIALAAILLAQTPAHATECKGLLYPLFGVDTGLSCEQRAALTGMGAALARSAPPPPAPVYVQPAPMQLQAPAMLPPPTMIFPMDGGAPTIFIPIR